MPQRAAKLRYTGPSIIPSSPWLQPNRYANILSAASIRGPQTEERSRIQTWSTRHKQYDRCSLSLLAVNWSLDLFDEATSRIDSIQVYQHYFLLYLHPLRSLFPNSSFPCAAWCCELLFGLLCFAFLLNHSFQKLVLPSTHC